MVKEILMEIKSKREKSFTTKKDIIDILTARSQENWNKVYMSNLYKNHGAEYCQLLEVISRRVKETIGK